MDDIFGVTTESAIVKVNETKTNVLCRSCSSALMSARGRVSRASPVHTVMRNCSRDEGRPFGFGDQVPIPSHCKLLRSKAVVVSVAGKSGPKPGRQG